MNSRTRRHRSTSPIGRHHHCVIVVIQVQWIVAFCNLMKVISRHRGRRTMLVGAWNRCAFDSFFAGNICVACWDLLFCHLILEDCPQCQNLKNFFARLHHIQQANIYSRKEMFTCFGWKLRMNLHTRSSIYFLPYNPHIYW